MTRNIVGASLVTNGACRQARARSALSARHDSSEASGTQIPDAEVRILPPQPASPVSTEKTVNSGRTGEAKGGVGSGYYDRPGRVGTGNEHSEGKGLREIEKGFDPAEFKLKIADLTLMPHLD